MSAKEEEVGIPCTSKCAEGESRWTVVVPGIWWRNWAALVLSKVALIESMVMSVMLLKMSTSTLWTKMLLRAVLILSLMAVVVEGSLDPSLLMMSFRSRRERPFLGEGALVVVVGGGAAGAGLAEVVVFFFFL